MLSKVYGGSNRSPLPPSKYDFTRMWLRRMEFSSTAIASPPILICICCARSCSCKCRLVSQRQNFTILKEQEKFFNKIQNFLARHMHGVNVMVLHIHNEVPKKQLVALYTPKSQYPGTHIKPQMKLFILNFITHETTKQFICFHCLILII